MPSVTTWSRLEPRARSADMRPSLEARVADPLWMLGRQWQIAEFHGDDAGSPVAVRARAEAVRLTRYRAGADGTPVDYEATRPLEALVEREPPTGVDRRRAAEGGAHFLRRLAEAGMSRHTGFFLGQCPLDLPAADERDADARRYLGLMAGRVPDGGKLAPRLRSAIAAGALDRAPRIPADDQRVILDVARGWLAWFEDEASGGDAWQADRMEHRFALGARGTDAEVVVSTAEYPGGQLDWHAFDAEPGATLGTPASAPLAITRTTLAAPARYPGMPAPRWWQFEDARVDFGGVEAGPPDLSRMLVVEYASLYSNDWHLMPLELPVGTLCRIRSLVVEDTFGERTLIGPADEPGSWSLFRLSPAGNGAPSLDRLLLAPALPAALESEPVEEVLLLRDEMANMAWAVERLVEGPTGRPRHRAEEAAALDLPLPALAAREPDPAVPLAYRLITTVPEHWIPFVPEEISPGANRLTRYAMERAQNGELVPIAPLGRLLAGDELSLFEGEVPREGARITRSWQRTRWVDGSTHTWLARRKHAGRGEGSSGLAFDDVAPAARDPAAYDAAFVDAVAYRDARLREPADLRALLPGQRAWVVVTVRNHGITAWRRGGALPLSLATLLPPEHPSALATAEWRTPSRPALVSEREVVPDAIGSFEFPIVAPLVPGPVVEHFNLVAGRQRWFPATAAFALHAYVLPGLIPVAGWESLGGMLAGAPTAGTLPDGRLAVFALHPDGSVRRLLGDTWSSLGGNAASAPVLARRGDGGLDVYVRGADGTLQVYGATEAWQSLGGAPAGAPAIATLADGRRAVFALHADGSARRLLEGTWSSLGGAAASAPVLARRADDGLDVFVRGTDGSLQMLGASGAWQSLGGSLASAPAVADLIDGRRIVVALHPDRSVRMLAGGQWTSLGGSATSTPVVARHADGRLEVLVRHADASLHAARETGGAFGPWEPLGGELSGGPAVATLADGRLVILAAHPDGTLRARRQASPGGPWAHDVVPWASRPGFVLGEHAELGTDSVLKPE